MEKQLKKRAEVAVEETWDLSLIYATEEELWKDAEKLDKLVDTICAKYEGKLKDAETIDACITDYQKMIELEVLVMHYTDLAASVDYTDAKVQDLAGQFRRKAAEYASRVNFIECEIMEQPEEVILEAISYQNGNSHYLSDLLRNKKYQLAPEAERVLKALNDTLDVPYAVYQSAKLADMKFDPFVVGEESFPLGYSLFEDDYEYDVRTDVRRKAFSSFSEKIRQYENVTAAAYNAEVQKQKVLADLRGFDNVFDSLLFPQKVERELYDRQIDLITEKLAPHMRKYAKLLQKIHKLDKMTFADLKLAVDPGYGPELTMDQAKKYIKDGLSVMGQDYVDMIEEAFTKRWFDIAKNQGKSTGGFCASPYGKNSFILLTWNGQMSDVFTMAHELGHAGHFKSCNASQSVLDTEVSTYFVEAPSTMNELLMAHYLLRTNDDKRFQRWVLSSMIQNTYYHNFVTHLMEAAYQREVYKLVDAGKSVQAETLNQIMKDTLTKFWGDAVEINEGAELTWMRQPHYYMGLYSYTYSAGLTVATQMCKRIEKEGQTAVEDWKKVLAAGSTLTPMELAKLAGVDISTDAPLLDTIDTIGQIIDDICRLTEELL